jgi:hypothetical protein
MNKREVVIGIICLCVVMSACLLWFLAGETPSRDGYLSREMNNLKILAEASVVYEIDFNEYLYTKEGFKDGVKRLEMSQYFIDYIDSKNVWLVNWPYGGSASNAKFIIAADSKMAKKNGDVVVIYADSTCNIIKQDDLPEYIEFDN